MRRNNLEKYAITYEIEALFDDLLAIELFIVRVKSCS